MQKQTVRYRGGQVRVPASWPVYRLAADPSRCVRFDRKAVYLGTPSGAQRCPAHAVGRPRAILVEPRPDGGVRLSRASASGIGRRAHRSSARSLRQATASATASYYTGLGFDACSAPSTTTMSAWLSSPYRGVGIYIGGLNRACSQPNLTAAWVGGEIAAGWGLIPIYVGRQAPANTCGCAAIAPAQAASQGTAAADDAVVQASVLGIGPGNPIYFDMEGYSRTAKNSSAVLTFLGAWTAELHAKGYVSGVYGSAASTIADLASQYGAGSPDDIWIARWNGVQSTADPAVPATAWANHQRLHQYQGGHNENYGGARINIDSNYLDGAIVGHASRPVIPPIRCRKVIFSRRPKSIAFRIKGVNLLHCGKARKVAKASERKRYTGSGRDRAYRGRGFVCHGHRRGRSSVVYRCRRVHSKARVVFVRRG